MLWHRLLLGWPRKKARAVCGNEEGEQAGWAKPGREGQRPMVGCWAKMEKERREKNFFFLIL
jgi:hypothetical protein